MFTLSYNWKTIEGISPIDLNCDPEEIRIPCFHNLCNEDSTNFFVKKKKKHKNTNWHGRSYGSITFKINCYCDRHRKNSSRNVYKIYNCKSQFKNFIKSVNKMCYERDCLKKGKRFLVPSYCFKAGIVPTKVGAFCKFHAKRYKKQDHLDFYSEEELVTLQIMAL